MKKESLANLKSVLQFLKTLAENNNREWFNANKDQYLHAKQCFDTLIGALLKKLVEFDNSLAGLDPSKLGFRIYRDVRFSKQKHPYKTNMGVAFSPTRKMEQEPGYYLHIEPNGKSFIAGGMYIPNKENLAKIRQEIDYNAEQIKGILKNRSFTAWYNGLDDFDQLKTNPRGYTKDHPQIDLLRRRSLIASHPFSDQETLDAAFVERVAKACRALKPLNDFLKTAIS